LSQTVSVHYNRSLIGTGKSIVSQIILPSSIPHSQHRDTRSVSFGFRATKHPRKWNCWSIGKTLHCQTNIQSIQMCSLQMGKYPMEFYWYAAISVPALFPRVGNSLPDRYKRKCIQSYLSCPAAALSVDPLPLYYNLSLVHRSLSTKSSICTSVLPAYKTPVNQNIYHLNTLHLYPAQTRKRTKKELPNSYIKLLN